MVYLPKDSEVSLIRAAGDSQATESALFCLSVDDLGPFAREFGFDLADKVLDHLRTVTQEVVQPIHLVQTPDQAMVGLIAEDLDTAHQRLERLGQRIGDSKLRFTVDGRQIAESITVSAGLARLEDAAPEPLIGALGKASAAWSEARRHTDRVISHVDLDPLTHLPTGETLEQDLGGSLAVSMPDSPVSILLIDIDGLDEVNAGSGTAAGDDVLKHVATELERSFSAQGTVGRLWADEFLVILPGVRTEDATFQAEEFRRNVEGHDQSGPVSLSVGVATYPRHASDPQELMRKAREARYASREQGGGRTSVAESDQMVTKTSHFSRTQLKRLAGLARKQDRSEAALLREGLDGLLQVYVDGASEASVFRHHVRP